MYPPETFLEEWLIREWDFLPEFFGYSINSSEGVRSQVATEAGRIDILARNVEEKKWLIIELKKDVAQEDALAQTLRYMGAFRSEFAEQSSWTVRGLIIAPALSHGLMYALKAVPSVSFKQYTVSYTLQDF